MKKWMIGLFIGLGSLGFAHQPFWNPGSPTLQQAYRVLEPTISKVVTGQLSAGQLDFYAFELAAGFVLDLGLFVGAACPATFQPRIWLVGPGVQGNQRPPFAIPDGLGARIFEGGWRDYRGHGLLARKGPLLRETLQGGTYYVVVDAGSAGGYYMLSLAGAEVAGGTSEGRAALARFNRCG